MHIYIYIYLHCAHIKAINLLGQKGFFLFWKPTYLGRQKLQMLQDAWHQCEGEWKKSELYKRILDKTTHSERGARVWLTRDQIAKKYDSWKVADEICDNKLADEKTKKELTKWHPDCPNAMRLFLVWDSEIISTQKDLIVEDLFQATDDSDEETTGKRGRVKQEKGESSKKKKKASSCASQSEPEGSEAEESGSESDEKAGHLWGAYK
eukprot:Skav235380  [mRNA]  locus=scaffold59:567469:568736:+ [translate_table: standard]